MKFKTLWATGVSEKRFVSPKSAFALCHPRAPIYNVEHARSDVNFQNANLFSKEFPLHDFPQHCKWGDGGVPTSRLQIKGAYLFSETPVWIIFYCASHSPLPALCVHSDSFRSHPPATQWPALRLLWRSRFRTALVFGTSGDAWVLCGLCLFPFRTATMLWSCLGSVCLPSEQQRCLLSCGL